jgi:uncharacterized protein (DUF362 family)
MDRREFIKRLIRYGAAGGALLLTGPGKLFGQPGGSGFPDLAAVRNGEPGAMLDRAMDALGGMGRFVKPGQKVAVKPNMSFGVEPERGASTNPALIKRLIEHCLDAGASRVYVFDHPLDSWQRAYEANGMSRAVKEGGGTIVPGHTSGYYHPVTVPGGKILKETKVHEILLESDVFINVPILKHHGSTRITCALKNLMGVVYNRRFYHSRGLNQCIADFPLYRKPDLNIVDAYRVLMNGGPRGSSYRAEVELRKMLIASPDIVAADTAAVKIWGTEPANVPYITIAEELGLGTTDLESLRIERIVI